jgi:hypothetical protein
MKGLQKQCRTIDWLAPCVQRLHFRHKSIAPKHFFYAAA